MTDEQKIAHPFSLLKEAIHADPEYAWGWHCNLAMPVFDTCFDKRLTSSANHERANQAAALMMRQLFDYDITKHPRYEGKKSVAQEYFELRVAAEEAEDMAA